MIYIPAYSLSFFNTRRSCLLPRLAQKETTALGPVQQLNLLPHIKKTLRDRWCLIRLFPFQLYQYIQLQEDTKNYSKKREDVPFTIIQTYMHMQMTQ
jgi:hypothetical protein